MRSKARSYNIGGRIKGEFDSEIGRLIEKGQRTDPGKAGKYVADKREEKKWAVDLDELERKDKEEREKRIRRIEKFLKEVAGKEKERQEEVRKRVSEITEEKLKDKKEETGDEREGRGLGDLIEPATKKRGSFMQKIRKKGSGGMAEAKGAIAKGGG